MSEGNEVDDIRIAGLQGNSVVLEIAQGKRQFTFFLPYSVLPTLTVDMAAMLVRHRNQQFDALPERVEEGDA